MLDTLQRRPGVVTLATDAISQAADLIQIEFQLFRAETTEKMVALKAGLYLLIAGAVLGLAALFLILQALVELLAANGVPQHWAVLIVAGATAATGFTLVVAGRDRLNLIDLAPERTLNSLSRDGRLAKEKLS